MTRQVTDQLYIDLDYFTPEEYFVYVAEAESAQSATATVSCDASVIPASTEAAADLTSTASLSTTAIKLAGLSADLTSNTTLSAQAKDLDIVEATLSASAGLSIQETYVSLAAADLTAANTLICLAKTNDNPGGYTPEPTYHDGFELTFDFTAGTSRIIDLRSGTLANPSMSISLSNISGTDTLKIYLPQQYQVSPGLWKYRYREVQYAFEASGLLTGTHSFRLLVTDTFSTSGPGSVVPLELWIDDVKKINGVATVTSNTDSAQFSFTPPLHFNFTESYQSWGTLVNGTIDTQTVSNLTLVKTYSYFTPVIASSDNIVTSNLTASALKVHIVSSSLSSAASMTTEAVKTARITDTLSAYATTEATAITASTASATLAAQATVTAQVEKSVVGLSQLNAAADMSVIADRVQGTASSLSVTAGLSANAIKVVDVTETLTANATVDINYLRIRDVDLAFESIATELAAAAKIGDFLVDMPVTSSMNTDAVIFSGSQSLMQSNFAFTITSTAIKSADAALSVTAGLEADVAKYIEFAADLQAQAALEIELTRIRLLEITAQAQVTVSADVNSILRSQIDLNTQSQLTAQAQAIVEFTANLDSRFDTAFVLGKLLRGSADLSAFYSTLTVGSILHLDELRTWRIPQETRILIIDPETRVQMIDQETRNYKIKGYTNVNS